MRKLFVICVFSLFLANCKSRIISKQEPTIEQVSIFYDGGEVLRIVSPTSNSLIRWSENPSKNHLRQWTIRNSDSLNIYHDLLISVVIDSTLRIPTVAKPSVSNSDGWDISYFDDTNDIPAIAMLIYQYEDKKYRPNDTLFLSSQANNKVRLNEYLAECDSMLNDNIKTILSNLCLNN